MVVLDEGYDRLLSLTGQLIRMGLSLRLRQSVIARLVRPCDARSLSRSGRDWLAVSGHFVIPTTARCLAL